MSTSWQKKHLGDIAKISSGKMISSKEISDTYSKGLYPCYGGNGLRGYVKNYLYNGQYPIIGRVGALCGNVHLTNGPFFPTEHALVVSIKTNDDPRFIEYLLKSMYYLLISMNLNQYAKGVAQPVLSASTISELSAYFPPISEQKDIVAELDLLSGIIEKKNAQLRTLDELANTIFYEMFGNPDDSPYDIKPLSKLSPFKLAYGSGASAVDYNGLVRYIRITDIEEGGTLTNAPMSPDTFDEKYLLNDGDILFARSGATVGKTYLYKKTEGKAIFAGYLIRFIPDERIVLPEYIYYFTRSQYYRSFVRLNAQAVAQPNINAQQYGGLKVSVPPMPLQKLFAKKIASINCQKEIIMLSVKSAQQLLESRMNSYFSI